METRLYKAGAVQSVPSMASLTSEGYPTGGNPAQGIPATKPGDAWFYAIGEEIRNAILAAGLTPSNSNLAQLAAALLSQNFPKGSAYAYASSKAYTLWDFVYHNNAVYVCTLPNDSTNPVEPGTNSLYWQKVLVESDISGIRMPIGMSVEWNSDELPDNGLWENGAEYDQTDYNLLYNVIGYRFGSTTAVKANCSLGEAFIAGANGNNIRITVAASGTSFLVSTYVGDTLKDQQLVTAITELKNHGYVVWDETATLTDGTDVTMTGGANGTSFCVPDKTGRYVRNADGNYPLGAKIAEQLPNITGLVYMFHDNSSGAVTSGAFSWNTQRRVNQAFFAGENNAPITDLIFNTHNSNSIYTDNGLILPSSISKQSYIIYK